MVKFRGAIRTPIFLICFRNGLDMYVLCACYDYVACLLLVFIAFWNSLAQ